MRCQLLNRFERRLFAVACKGGGMFCEGLRAERHVIEGRGLSLALVVLQERPVLAVIILVAGKQVELRAPELKLANSGEFT